MKNKISKNNVPSIVVTTDGHENSIFDWLYIFFLATLPLVYVNSIVDPVLVPRQMALALFNLICVALIIFRLSANPKTQFAIIFQYRLTQSSLLLFTFILVSFLSSSVLSESFAYASRFSLYLVFFVITTGLLISGQLRMISLIMGVLVLSFFCVAFALFQIIHFELNGNNYPDYIGEITASSANKNLLASLLFMTFPFVLYSLFQNGLKKYLAMGVFFSEIIIIALLQSKAVYLSTLIFVMGTIVLTMKKLKTLIYWKRIRVFIYVLSPVIILLFFAFVWMNKEIFPNLFNNNSLDARVTLWENSIKMIRDHFVFGVGAGNWQFFFPVYGINDFIDVDINNGMTTFQRPHNDFLWVFAELGLFGFISYILIFLFVFFYILKIYFRKISENLLYAFLIPMFLGYVVIGNVDFPLERLEHQILFFLSLAIVLAEYIRQTITNPQSHGVIFNRGVLFSLFMISLISLYVCYYRYNGEYYVKRVHAAHRTNNWSAMIKNSNLAESRFYKIDPMSIPIEWYKGVALFSLGKIEDARFSFNLAYDICPNSIHVLNNFAGLLEKTGDHYGAIQYYQKALEISPNFDESILNLSAVYFNIKDYEKSYMTISKCSTSSSDAKYRKFLVPILSAYGDKIVNSRYDENMSEKWNALKNSPDSLLDFQIRFLNSKMSFEDNLFLYLHPHSN